MFAFMVIVASCLVVFWTNDENNNLFTMASKSDSCGPSQSQALPDPTLFARREVPFLVVLPDSLYF